jgi:hypothetical protein
MSAPDLELEACLKPWTTVKSLDLGAIKNESVKGPANAYDRNIRRVWSLTIFPAVTINATHIIEKRTYEKKLEYRRKVLTGSITKQQFAEIVQKAIDADADEREKILAGGGKEATELLQREAAFGFGVLTAMLSRNLRHGADAWLSAQITGTWTAFEALAEEIWVAAVNAHPVGLADLDGAKKGTGEEKKIDLSVLQRYGYNPSNHMGTVLSRRYSFDRIEDIRRAYHEASFEGDAKINEIITDRALDALSLTRHVIVHNGGVVDEQFLRRKNDLPAAILGNVGEALPLTGTVTSDLVSPVMRRGWELISAVDDWLSAH